MGFIGACAVPLLASLLAVLGASLIGGYIIQDNILVLLFIKLFLVMVLCGSIMLADSTSRKLFFSVLATMRHG
jgi:hypothetical protein